MRINRKISRVIALATLLGSTVALATPSQALVESWPAAGHKPDCDSIVSGAVGGTDYSLTYADKTAPVIVDAGTPTKAVIGPTTSGKLIPKFGVRDTCSGVGNVVLIYRRQDHVLVPVNLQDAHGSAFDDTWSAGIVTLSPTTPLQVISYSLVYAFDRYDTVTLDSDFRFLGSTAVTTARGGYLKGPAPKTYIVAASKLTIDKTSITVKKGKSISLGTQLYTWDRAVPGWSLNKSVPVVLQQLVAGKWVTRTSGSTDAFGKKTFTVATPVVGKAYYRTAYLPSLTSLKDSTTSSIVTVTVRK